MKSLLAVAKIGLNHDSHPNPGAVVRRLYLSVSSSTAGLNKGEEGINTFQAQGKF